MSKPVPARELAAVRKLARAGSASSAENLRPALDACDPVRLASALHDQQLLGLLGSRALAAWGPDAPQRFAEVVGSALAADRSRAMALEALTAEFVDRLDATGIRTLVLKGPLLARRLHGDAGFRSSNDIDLLVRRADLDAAARVLKSLGYEVEPSVPLRSHGLPDLHIVLKNPSANLPRIDLHWRVHWYEDDFSADLLDRATREPGATFLEPEAADDLATLLLLYARDGFYGLRKAVDIAAWWDRNAADGQQPLARHWRDYPRLRKSLAAAALAAERAVGVPAERLLPQSTQVRLRPRLAANLASWNQMGNLDQLLANVAVVDALLSPARELRHFARRELFVTREEIESMYGLPPSARRRVTALRVIHAPKVTVRYLAGLWSAIHPPPARYVGAD